MAADNPKNNDDDWDFDLGNPPPSGTAPVGATPVHAIAASSSGGSLADAVVTDVRARFPSAGIQQAVAQFGQPVSTVPRSGINDSLLTLEEPTAVGDLRPFARAVEDMAADHRRIITDSQRSRPFSAQGQASSTRPPGPPPGGVPGVGLPLKGEGGTARITDWGVGPPTDPTTARSPDQTVPTIKPPPGAGEGSDSFFPPGTSRVDAHEPGFHESGTSPISFEGSGPLRPRDTEPDIPGDIGGIAFALTYAAMSSVRPSGLPTPSATREDDTEPGVSPMVIPTEEPSALMSAPVLVGPAVVTPIAAAVPQRDVPTVILPSAPRWWRLRWAHHAWWTLPRLIIALLIVGFLIGAGAVTIQRLLDWYYYPA